MIITSVVAAGASACYGKIRGGGVGITKAEVQDERTNVRDQRELEQRLSGGVGASEFMEHIEPVESFLASSLSTRG